MNILTFFTPQLQNISTSSAPNLALIMNGNEVVREAVTKPLNLTEGDVIYFMVNILLPII